MQYEMKKNFDVVRSCVLTRQGEAADEESKIPVCQKLWVRTRGFLSSSNQPDDQDNDVKYDHPDESSDKHCHVAFE